MKLSRVLVSLLTLGSAVGAASQKSVYRNPEYGIVLPIPPGTLPCIPPIWEGNGADHGPQILLGTKDATLCSQYSGKRYMGVFASYNASDETKTLHALLESTCEFEIKRVCSPAPGGLLISGLKREAGRLDRSDGLIKIIVATQAGKPDPDFDAYVPSDNYEPILDTDMRHLDEDLAVFRTLLKTIKIALPSH